MMQATARARANIALAKYWGKSDITLNLPAVPSLSLTLDPLTTTTSVTFSPDFDKDSLTINDQVCDATSTLRTTALLDRVRKNAGITLRARVASTNSFPTASGLASSASGFAALACAASSAAGLSLGHPELSALARASSASAARSIYPGFVTLEAGAVGEATLHAESLFGADHWNVCMVIAVTSEGEKDVGSTSGMETSRLTSPYYEAWLLNAPRFYREVREGVGARDIERVGNAMEQSTFAMHACAMASSPSISYLRPATLLALEVVRRLRREKSLGVYATMDAGPHVKALCHVNDAATVEEALRQTEGVLRVIRAIPGLGVELLP